jgi:DNA-binding CsgD family transcriptional regulator
VLAIEENDVTVLELDRPPDRAPFGAAEVEGLERLLPGLQLAVRCLLRSAAVGDMQARVFNRLPVAVAQIGANREILFHNHALRYLLAQADGLRVASDRIRACAVQEDRVLADRVRRAIAGIRADDLLPIGRPSGRPAYLVHIEPLRHRAHRSPANTSTAMLVALSPGDCDRDTIVRFGTGYGLTGAEIRIVQFMLEGQGVDDIAGRLHGSANTVRWHLKSIYAKSGAAGQADLVRLFMHAMHLSIA